MNTTIRFACNQVAMYDKIAVIKALRCLTGVALKDAKDMSERVGEQTATIDYGNFSSYSKPEQGIEAQKKILRNNGVVVNSVYTILQDLRDLSIQALEQGEDELANEILQLVLIQKLRRTV